MQQGRSTTAGLAPAARSPLLAKYGALVVAALLTVVLADGALFLLRERASDWVDHSRAVRTTARDAQLNATERRAALNAFISSHDSAFLAADARARIAARMNLDSLVGLTADNASQRARARSITRAYAQWDSAFAGPALAVSGTSETLKGIGPAFSDRSRSASRGSSPPKTRSTRLAATATGSSRS